MKNINSYLKQMLRIVLCVALSLPQVFWATVGHASQNLAQPLASDADQQRKFVVDTQIEDLMFLTHQTHRRIDFSKGGAEAGGIENYSLTAANVLNPFVSAPTDLSKLKVSYFQPDEGKQNGRIEMAFRTSKASSRHIIHGFDEFTAPPAEYSTGNLLRFATRKGLYVIPLRWFKDSLFRAPVPVLHLLPTPPIEGARITDIQVQHLVTDDLLDMVQQDSAYKHLIEKPLLMDVDWNEKDYMFSGDVVMRIETSKGTEHQVFEHADEALEIAKRLSLLYWWASLYDPDQQNDEAMKNIQKLYAEEVSDLFVDHAVTQPQQKHKQHRHDLIMRAMAQISRTKVGMQALLNAVPKEEVNKQGEIVLQSVLHQVALQDRQAFTLKQQREAWQEKMKIYESELLKLKAKRLVFSRAIIEAANKKIGPEKWRQMSRSTQRILGLTGAGVAAALGGQLLMPEAFAYVLHRGLKPIQNWAQTGAEFLRPVVAGVEQAQALGHKTVDWMSQMPLLSELPLITENSNFWYWAGGAVAVGLFFNLSVWLNSLLVRSNHTRSWTDFRKFYLTMLRVMGTLNYPLQAMVWEKMFRQRILYGALDHGLTLTDMPWRTKKGFRVPPFLHSPFASERDIKAAAHKVNRALEQKTINNRRAGFLAGVALASKIYKMDPATLLMAEALGSEALGSASEPSMSTAVQLPKAQLQGVQTSSKALTYKLTDEESQADWVALHQHLLRLYLWLQREYRDNIDASVLKKSYDHYAQVAQKLQKRSGLKEHIQHMWQKSKKGMSDFAENYVVFGSDWRHFSRHLKTLDPNQRTTEIARMTALTDYRWSFLVISPVFMHTAQSMMAGRLFAAPFVDNIWRGIPPVMMSQTMATPAMGGEQIALAANSYIGAEQQILLDDLKEQHHRPLVAFYFDQEGESLKQKKNRKQIAQLVSASLFEATGVPYTSDDLLLKEARKSFREDLTVMRQDIWQGGLPRAFEQHMQVIKRLIGSMAHGSLVTAMMWMPIPIVAGVLLSTSSPLNTDANVMQQMAEGIGLGIAGAIQVFFIKHSFLGYTHPWPYVYYFADMLKQNSSAQAKQLESALFHISMGVRIQERKLVVQGVRELLTLYQKAEHLPSSHGFFKSVKQLALHQKPDLQVTAKDLQGKALDMNPKRAHHYSNQQAALLFKYALAHPPVATQPNKKLRKHLLTTALGVFGSTILAFGWVYKRVITDLPNVYYSQGFDAAAELMANSLLLSFGGLAGTVGFLKLGMSPWFHAKLQASFERLSKLKASCQDLLRHPS